MAISSPKPYSEGTFESWFQSFLGAAPLMFGVGRHGTTAPPVEFVAIGIRRVWRSFVAYNLFFCVQPWCMFSSLLSRQICCSYFWPLSLPLLLAVLACCQAASWSGTASGVFLAGASLRNTFESRVLLDKQYLQRILSLRKNTTKCSDLRLGRTIWVLGAVC